MTEKIVDSLRNPVNVIIAITLLYTITAFSFRYQGYHFEEIDNQMYICDKNNEVCVAKHLDGHSAFLKLFQAYPNE